VLAQLAEISVRPNNKFCKENFQCASHEGVQRSRNVAPLTFNVDIKYRGKRSASSPRKVYIFKNRHRLLQNSRLVASKSRCGWLEGILSCDSRDLINKCCFFHSCDLHLDTIKVFYLRNDAQ